MAADRRDVTQALAGWRQGAINLSDLAIAEPEWSITSVAEARALVDAILHLHSLPPERLDEVVPLATLIPRVSGDAAFDLVWREGLASLVELVAVRYISLSENSVLYLFKLYAAMQYLPGIQQIVDFIRLRRYADGFLWSDILDHLHVHEPLAMMVIEALGRILPDGYCGLAYLELCNALSREAHLCKHPFDTPEGHARLRDWLIDTANAWQGRAASAALPFISGVDQVELVSMGLSHPLAEVRLEAAWAAARLGDREARDRLLVDATDPLLANLALGYLQELDAVGELPETVFDPAFQAKLAMVQWLSDPSEFGEAPTAIEVFDRRILHWPPTDDVREVFLLRFTYAGSETGEDATFVGMAGSMTCSLIGESDSGMSAEDLYGLHCCWELERRSDPRSPGHRSAATGRKLIDLDNPGRGFWPGPR